MLSKREMAFWLAVPVIAGYLLRNDPYSLSVLTFILIYGLLSMATTLCMGHAGQVTLAQAGFFAIGAYCSANFELRFGLPFVAGFVASILLSGLCGYGLGYPILRVKGHFLGLITLAFTQVVDEVAQHWTSVTGGANGLYGLTQPTIPVPWLSPLYGFVLLLIAFWFATLVGASHLIGSRYGRAMHMLKASEWGAQACGIDVARYKSDAFAISAAICGGAGAFYAHFIQYIGPESFTLDVSIGVIAMCILGGMADLRGAILGAAVMTLLNEPLRNVPRLQPVLYALVILFVIVLLPRGVVPSLLRWRAARPWTGA
jgi:branched-chain amino acid transport system permease protein